MTKISAANEVWIGTALLHRENVEVKSFTVTQIVDRVAKENIFGRLRPTVQIHCYMHSVANKRPNPNNYRMLYKLEKSGYRLFKDTDDYHPYREGSKTRPEKHEIPEKYHELIEWYLREYNK